MSIVSGIVISAVALAIFFSLRTKGVGFVLDILATPK